MDRYSQRWKLLLSLTRLIFNFLKFQFFRREDHTINLSFRFCTAGKNFQNRKHRTRRKKEKKLHQLIDLSRDQFLSGKSKCRDRWIAALVYRPRELERRVITVYLNDMHRECWPCHCVNACLTHASRPQHRRFVLPAPDSARFASRNRVQLCEKGSGNRARKEDQSDSEIPLTSPRERDHDGNRMDPCCPMPLQGYRGWNTSSLVFFNWIVEIVTAILRENRSTYKRDRSMDTFV